MNRFIVEHRIAPVIDRVFDVDSIADAYDHLRSVGISAKWSFEYRRSPGNPAPASITGIRSQLLEPGCHTYREACPRSGWDPTARLRVMDEEGIDVCVLYPTIGLTWEGHVEDPALAAAYCRAYNAWLIDFCRAAPARLVGAAHLSLLDLDEAAREARRVAKAGMRAAFVRPDLTRGKPLGHRDFDPFWAECEALGLPVGLHVVAREDRPLAAWWRGQQRELGYGRSGYMFHFAFLSLPVAAAFTSLLQGGTLERLPLHSHRGVGG